MKQQDFVSGWKPQPADSRDFRFAVSAPAKQPASIDLAPYTGPVLNQGSIGSCTANAISTAMYNAKAKKGDTFVSSRLFIYYEERAMIDTVNEDSGAYIRDGFKVINKLGTPRESTWPYIQKDFTVKPSPLAYTKALEHQAIEYYALPVQVDAIKGALIEGFPVVFGFDVFTSFFKIRKSKPKMPMPVAGEELVGGHAVIIVGYSNRRKCFKVQNSWGERWGEKGFFWMPYEYVSDTSYTGDFWVLRAVE